MDCESEWLHNLQLVRGYLCFLQLCSAGLELSCVSLKVCHSLSLPNMGSHTVCLHNKYNAT